MLQLDLPHINVLSKIDLLSLAGDLRTPCLSLHLSELETDVMDISEYSVQPRILHRSTGPHSHSTTPIPRSTNGEIL